MTSEWTVDYLQGAQRTVWLNPVTFVTDDCGNTNSIWWNFIQDRTRLHPHFGGG